MKIISPRMHGMLDFVVVLAFVAAPKLLHLDGLPATISYALAAVHLLVTLVTAFPMGVFPVLSFPQHGALELLVSLVLVALPWIAGFAADLRAREFYMTAGVVILIVTLLTDYRRGLPART